MSLFTGSQQQALQAAVEDAFDADDLARLAKFRLGQSLQVMVQTDRALSAVVFDLIQFVESRGWTDEFVRGVYEERKDNLVVRQFCEANAQFVFVPRASTTELAREVGSGLDAVTGRMANKTDPVRAILAGQASLTLSDLGTQFTRLRKYKVLHDCLHNLQFKYARLIKTEIRVFKDDLNAADNLGTYFQEMSDELTQARPQCEGLESLAAEQMWFNVANESVRRMKSAVVDRKVDDLVNGFQLLDGILRVQPTRINELLTGLLERLQLDRLRKTLVLMTTSAGEGIDRAVVALGNLAPRLNRILAEHNEWQLVDNTLHQIDTELKLGSGVEQCSFLWSEVEKVLNPLLDRDSGASWSVELRQLGMDLTGSFETLILLRVRTAFDRFFPRATWFFYQADKDLKELSGELDKVGDKLRDILLEVGNEHA